MPSAFGHPYSLFWRDMSFNISSRLEELSERLFVEASAGTGKTYVIEHYIVRLLPSLNLRKLALITFTKAVARELRLRLRATLQKTHAYVTGHCDGDAPDYLRPVLDDPDTVKRKALARTIEESLEQLPGAMITTIHGFCDRLLTAWADETDGACGDEWMGEEQIRQWLMEFLHEGAGLRAYEVVILSRQFKHNQNVLIEHLAQLMDGETVHDDQAWEDAQAAVELVRREVPVNGIAEALSQKARGYRDNVHKNGALKKERVDGFLAVQQLVEEGVSEEAIDRLAQAQLSECFAVPLVKQPPSMANAGIAEAVVNILWDKIRALVDGEMITMRLSQRARKAFHIFLQKTGKKTPDTVLRRVLALSNDSQFLAFVATQVDCLIVDEFQDTDGVQYTIFSRLFLENALWKGRVLFVGDPKQSIYGFRKADVYSYLEARSAVQSNRCVEAAQLGCATLSVNFRAEPAVVAAHNRLFAGPEQRHIFFMPKTGVSLDVVPCCAGKASPPVGIDDGRHAVHVTCFRGRLGRKKRWPHDELEREAVFPWVADEIVALHTLGVPLRQQAILIKDRYQARDVQNFLESRSIPSFAWKVDMVTESPAYHWLAKAFSLAAMPTDQQRLSSLLLSMPTTEHIQLCRAMASEGRLDQWASCVQAWNAVKEAFVEHGLGGMGRALFACRWNGQQTVEEWLYGRPHGATLVTDVEHLFELLSRLEERLPHSIDAVCDALGDLDRYYADEPELLIRRVNPDDEAVPILTMHGSKGLEFDVVYALGAATRTTMQQKQMEIAEVDAEKLRQLYVSVTRAKRRCYVPLLLDEDGRKVPLGHASPIELLFGALSLPISDPLTSWTASVYASITPSTLLTMAQRLVTEVPHAFSLSESGPQRHASLPSRGAPSVADAAPLRITYACRRYRSSTSMKKETPSMVVASPRGHSENTTFFGTTFHNAMASLVFAPRSARQSCDAVFAWCQEHGYDGKDLSQLLFDACHVKFSIGGEEVCLQDVSREEMRVECSFLDHEGDNHYVRGAIDLIFVWKAAAYIVDWKTHYVEDGQFEQYVHSNYDVQHDVYVSAVQRAFSSDIRFGEMFFVFVRHLHDGGIIAWR
jgi:exodeoxyribonuclease V beta subunit